MRLTFLSPTLILSLLVLSFAYLDRNVKKPGFQWQLKSFHNHPGFREKLKSTLKCLIASAWLMSTTPTVPTHAIDTSYLTTAETQLIDLFQRNIPSVVYINTFVERVDFFSMNVMEVPAGTGSGFVWDTDGHIVTNYHVIRNAETAKVTVTNPDGKTTRTYKAKVIGVDPDKDVAVLQVESKLKNNGKINWKPIKLGSSANLKVGQYAIAIGNPFGLDHTLTTGVVSGLGREVRSPSNKPISNVIQTGIRQGYIILLLL
jgi:S1-C subfamily serine protease